MALTWNVKEVVDREGKDYVWPDDKLSTITEALIWSTMGVGIGRITEDNWQTFATRLRAYETALGSLRYDCPPIEVRHVKRHIGLATNVSSLTEAKFRKQLIDRVMREAQDAVHVQLRAIEKEAVA
jgi:hypothetical protein